MKKNLLYILTFFIFFTQPNALNAQECVNDDSIIESAFNTLSTCDETVEYLINNYQYTTEQACAWNGNMGNGPLFGGMMVSDFCECTCALETTCDEGYSLLTLEYSDANDNSFTVMNSSGEMMAQYSDLNGSGSIEDCFLTSDGSDCFSIDIEGGSELTWDLLVDDIILLSGDASDFEFGPECEDGDCTDDNDMVNQYFGNFFISECSGLIDYLISNYNYTSSQACGWNGVPMVEFGGMIVSDFCECSCQEEISINEYIKNKELISIKDMLGRSVLNRIYNTPLLYIYNDGTVEKITIKK